MWPDLYLMNLLSYHFFTSLLFVCLTAQMNEHFNVYKTFVRMPGSSAGPEDLLTFPRPGVEETVDIGSPSERSLFPPPLY